MKTNLPFDHLPDTLKQPGTGSTGSGLIIEQQVKISRQKQEEEEMPKEVLRRLRIQNKKLMEQIAVLKSKLENKTAGCELVRQQLAEIQKLNNSLAEALGSCNNCWGEETDCSHCSGQGAPGWKDINKRMFNLYILPALEKLYTPGK